MEQQRVTNLVHGELRGTVVHQEIHHLSPIFQAIGIVQTGAEILKHKTMWSKLRPAHTNTHTHTHTAMELSPLWQNDLAIHVCSSCPEYVNIAKHVAEQLTVCIFPSKGTAQPGCLLLILEAFLFSEYFS